VIVGRFAPAPTGPLHFGSLVAAVGSWLFARSAGGRWLVRIEDLDTPRVVRGSAEEILEALRRYGLDGEVVWQSCRTKLYDEALRTLRERSLVYECACSRADIQRAASAPIAMEPRYPGTCRGGLAEGRVVRAVRFRAPEAVIAFDDIARGRVEKNVAKETGDFVVKRADGPYAYQLAVVVDDAAQEGAWRRSVDLDGAADRAAARARCADADVCASGSDRRSGWIEAGQTRWRSAAADARRSARSRHLGGRVANFWN
jgi:glutamyl-Q tRNA(Asp) synthetase